MANKSVSCSDDQAKITTLKMTTKSKGKGQLPTKSERSSAVGDDKTPTSSGPLSGLKDPRIVRVSRAFGGKDRHSKVSTIRGLRDRRVRLSVSTAIQLYDLQDRLGLNQPSKAVDWLLNAAQHEIDKLPPLQLPPRNFDADHEFQHHQALIAAKAASGKMNNHQECLNDHEGAHIQLASSSDNKVIRMEMDHQDAAIYNAQHDHQPAAHPRGNQVLGGLLSSGMPYASYYHWDPSNRSFLSQLGILSSQSVAGEDPDPAPNPSSHSLMTNSTPAPSQLIFCPSGVLTPPMFSSYMNSTSPNDFDGRQFVNHLQMGSASSAAQQDLPPNATIRASFHSGSPKARPF